MVSDTSESGSGAKGRPMVISRCGLAEAVLCKVSDAIVAAEHAALEVGGQDIAQHHQRLFVGAGGNGIEARVRVGDADELGLCAVDAVAEDSAAGRAMRVHELAAIHAFAAGVDARDQDPVSQLERCHNRPNLVDDAYAFVAQDAARLAARHVTLEDVQVGAADGRLGYLHDRVCWDCRFRTLLRWFLSRTRIDESFYCDIAWEL